ncbi:hypothetical protein [Ornithinibacillus xuwenensis]|uniref:Uncharacterized protein n=1 Tax=Ornithinibacillus xuwenensis TaxID=3144668 RepID=A0ABU9XBY2_9BACI
MSNLKKASDEVMIQDLLRRIFYSRIFNNVRKRHYKNAYKQGRFDEAWLNTFEEEGE